jgi:hypothetical protein
LGKKNTVIFYAVNISGNGLPFFGIKQYGTAGIILLNGFIAFTEQQDVAWAFLRPQNIGENKNEQQYFCHVPNIAENLFAPVAFRPFMDCFNTNLFDFHYFLQTVSHLCPHNIPFYEPVYCTGWQQVKRCN